MVASYATGAKFDHTIFPRIQNTRGLKLSCASTSCVKVFLLFTVLAFYGCLRFLSFLAPSDYTIYTFIITFLLLGTVSENNEHRDFAIPKI